MIEPGAGATIDSGSGGVPSKAGKIEVGNMTVRAGEGRQAPASPESKPVGKSETISDVAVDKAAAKKRAEEAGQLLKEYHIEPRVVMRLLSSNDATLNALRGQQNAEMQIANGKNLSPAQKDRLFHQIKEKYKKLLDLVGEREEQVTSKINKLKKSKKPEDQALSIDIHMGMIKMRVNQYQERVDLISNGINPDTTEQISSSEKTQYDSEKATLSAEIAKMNEKLGDSEQGTGLKGERAKVKNKKGETIPDLLEATVVAMAGGDATVIKKEKDDPIRYLEETLAGAITDEAKMNSLVQNMKTSELIGDEKDENKFREALNLSSLNRDEIVKMMASNSGKKLLIVIEMLGFLGYIASQRESKNNQQQ